MWEKNFIRVGDVFVKMGGATQFAVRKIVCEDVELSEMDGKPAGSCSKDDLLDTAKFTKVGRTEVF